MSESEWNGAQRPDLSKPPRRKERERLNQIATKQGCKDDMKGEINHFEEFDHVDFNDMYPCRFCLNFAFCE